MFKIAEKVASGRDLVVVDIQPEYENAISFPISQFTNYLNRTPFNKIFYTFNGPDLGFKNWSEVSYWLIENGLDESKLDEIEPFDKGYAFFRSFMDLGMDEANLLRLLKYMHDNKIYDSRDVDEEIWASLNLDWDWDPNGDAVFIPDVLFKLDRYKNPLICGGGRDECLREVELCFRILNKPYQLLTEFIY
jgi:hypothetical protein